MPTRLAGKVAVVTGSGRGIGRGIALALAREGASVVVNDVGGTLRGTDKSAAPADDVVAEIRKAGGAAVASYDSVASFTGAEGIIAAALKHFGRLDILVNNAGITRPGDIDVLSEEDWDAVIGVHLKGTYNCTRHAAPVMKKQRSGRIINMVSRVGLLGTPGNSNYGAAKGAIFGFTNCIARELGPFGVTVNCISPGASDTRMVQERMKELASRGLRPQDAGSRIQAINPPEHIAPMALFLASDEAANINGQVFYIEGGQVSWFQPLTPARSIFKDGGLWTLEELLAALPKALADLPSLNPAPPK